MTRGSRRLVQGLLALAAMSLAGCGFNEADLIRNRASRDFLGKHARNAAKGSRRREGSAQTASCVNLPRRNVSTSTAIRSNHSPPPRAWAKRFCPARIRYFHGSCICDDSGPPQGLSHALNRIGIRARRDHSPAAFLKSIQSNVRYELMRAPQSEEQGRQR